MPGVRDWPLVAGFLARARARYRALLHRDALEAEMREEFRHHLAERTDHLVRLGLSREDADSRARREFGHVGSHRAQAQEALGLASFRRLRVSWLDLRLALRMLPRYPVLNLAAAFALAVGIPVGLAPSHLARVLEAPLPGDRHDRVRAVRQWDPLAATVAPTWDGEFTFWSQSLQSFSSLGAFRPGTFNVASGDGRATPTAGAQLTASVFPMIGARPLLGRALQGDDFALGAPDVVVIGHSLWESRFGRSPDVLGREIRIGRSPHVIVGVMPDGFAFPTDEALWLPLRLPSVGESRNRVRVQVLGRLDDGVTAEQAQAELSSRRAPLSTAATADEARERARLRAEVVPFGFLFLSLPAGGLRSLPEYRWVKALALVILLVASGNVAMLVFARTATRLRELAIRTSLGATRACIVSQIFVETFVLAALAAGIGVLAADWALLHLDLSAVVGVARVPYWLSLGLTRDTALGAIALAAVSATVAGVVPAIVITGRSVSLAMRGGSPMRFGRLVGALLVADIALSVAAVGMAFTISGHATDLEAADRATGIPASEYLAVELRLPEGARPSLQHELVAAIEAEPGVRRVAVGDVLPRMEHRSRAYEVDGIERGGDAPLRWTRVARIDVGFLGALGTPIVEGRDFTPADTKDGARTAIVNRAFVQRVLGGADPIGRRVRFPTLADTSDAAWYRIVGVVGPLGVNVLNPDRGDAIYLPAAPGAITPMQLAVHAAVPPASLIARVREIATAVDPDVVMGRASVLSDVRPGDWYLVMGVAVALVVLVGVLIALATSGLYAMLSLAVSERTREIGIRAALGASRRALLAAILRRSLVQIALGALIGLPLAARFVFELTRAPAPEFSVAETMAIALGLATAIVALVAVSACLLPSRRILAIEASEAMRAEG